MRTQPLDSLSWTITSREAADRLRRRFWTGLTLAAGTGGPVVLAFILEEAPSGWTLLWLIGLPIWVMLLIYVCIEISRPPSRGFALSAQGVRVRKGTRSGFFPWDQLEYFTISEGERKDAQANDGSTGGNSYYLRLKGGGSLKKTYLLLFSEAENDPRVREFLTRHLRYEPWSDGDQLGLIAYLFK
jgi:hypothetical protein